MAEHIVKAFDNQLLRLEDAVTRMGGLSEAALVNAIGAVTTRDTALATATVQNDTKIDELQREINDLALRILALRQPMASDLRTILATISIAGDLERIADYAANVAKRSIALNQQAPVRPVGGIPRMAARAQGMIKDVLDAYADRDAEKAMAVWQQDEALDELYTSLFRELLTYMMEDPRAITPCTHLLFIAKNIERIGDHATNIAENIYFMVKGTPLLAHRPKGSDETITTFNPAPPTAAKPRVRRPRRAAKPTSEE